MPAPLILGTAQLGQAYGIANTTGRPEQQEANSIVRTTWDAGITHFDTAQVYGNSESILGTALRHCNATKAARIITKLAPTLPADAPDLRASITQSLLTLGVKKLYCLMLHREDQLPLLDDWQGEVMKEFLDQGAVERLGVSVYTPEAALRALEHPLLSVVQIPASLFDRRFAAAGIFEAARKTGKELHIRSVFLQGVLGMPPKRLPATLSALAPYLTELRQTCALHGCASLQGALGWMLQRYPESYILFGAETADQVRQNIDFAVRGATLPTTLYQELDAIFPPQFPELLNPALWRR
ncbi:MAG: aldo/keto reductase [Desulfovibrio sp.]|jgi:aryl-alcohol dehydrogenase-like predicted oxidoreductase|nr:aldo/keto reductase [Desulfovibrio sp.]